MDHQRARRHPSVLRPARRQGPRDEAAEAGQPRVSVGPAFRPGHNAH